jgi:LmbE family N-acetylglucosaminyl deacetylase
MNKNPLTILMDSKSKRHCLFISPHLDDAVFSAGALMCAMENAGVPLSMVNVFTKAGSNSTLSAQAFLKQCHFTNAHALFRARINEDKKAVKDLRIPVVNLGFTDALWRKKPNVKIGKTFSSLIPSLVSIYPTYRWHIIKGKISVYDKETEERLKEKLRTLIKKHKNPVLLCPIGAGNHVDHILVRDVCAALSVSVVYWLDYPYSRTFHPDMSFIKAHHLKKYTFSKFLKEKEDIMNKYKTQLQVFQPIKDSKELIETYYIKI